MDRTTRALLASLALIVAAGLAGCAPRPYYDPREGLLTRTDEAFTLPLGMRDRVRWQYELPGAGGAPERYSFPYDAILYKVRIGTPGQPPEILVVFTAWKYPDAITKAPTIVERNRRLAEQVKVWLIEQDMQRLAAREDRFVYDGRLLAVSEKDAEEAIQDSVMGAAFLFGAEYALEALYEIYPPAEGGLSAKEHQEILEGLATILGRATVK
jgi:hypothetical protein